MPPRAVYVHVPFCAHRCGYCNFSVVAGRDDLWDKYLDALDRELSAVQGRPPIDTIYFGGGTPTQLGRGHLDRLFTEVKDRFRLADDYEWTVEANPADLDEPSMQVLVDHGVNRISLGIQSFDNAKLATLERNHRRPQIMRAVSLVQATGAALCIDLIFGVPAEAQSTWETDLKHAVQMHADHISTYGLTFEKGTLFWNRKVRGELIPVDEQRERAMYLTAIDRLQSAGYEHYEISSFARAGARSRHNIVYWTGQSYYAFGPGAARYVDGRRETNHRSTTTYIQRMLAGRSPIAETERLNAEDRARERLIFGLRMLDGVDRDTFQRETGYEFEELCGDVIEKYIQLGMLQSTGGRLRLTREGLLLSDGLWPEFVVE